MKKQIISIQNHYNTLHSMLSEMSYVDQNYIKFSKELSDLESVVQIANAVQDAENQISSLRDVLQSTEYDDEMKAIAKDELDPLIARHLELSKKLQIALLPRDLLDERNAILEIRAGTGGDEAGLFAGDLCRMYQKYAEHMGWKFEVLSLSENDIGSIREVTASITGSGVFAYLKFESGVHRVQRVPVTEASGRVHTSTATVAVLPEASDVDVKIDEKDLKIDVMRASGAGGQHVNKTESAIRITHLPTGIVVCQQDERSQHMNRMKAMKILLSRVSEVERQRQHSERANERRNQIGTAERSERIRTYNFPQGRVSDHRINLTLYKIEQIMDGYGLVEVIDALIQHDQQEKLAQIADVEEA